MPRLSRQGHFWESGHWLGEPSVFLNTGWFQKCGGAQVNPSLGKALRGGTVSLLQLPQQALEAPSVSSVLKETEIKVIIC